MNIRKRPLSPVLLFPLLVASLGSAGCQRDGADGDPGEATGEKHSENQAVTAAMRTIDATPEVSNDLGMHFVAIKPATFDMGSPEQEAGRADDEALHKVTVAMPFYLGRTEVTQKQWETVMGSNPSRFKGQARPVDSVSLEDAKAFVAKLSKRDGASYRLPTEAEWELGCRAGTTTPYAYGQVLRDAAANVRQGPANGAARENEAERGTKPVGSYPPTPNGLSDIHGNVFEWTQSGVLRGGAWNFSVGAARCASRLVVKVGSHYDVNGLRVVRDLAR